MLADRYRIVALLGRGGMGEVYRADDLKLGETIALKFLPERLERDASLRERLIVEARNARQVAHPNICRVYDVGEADGRLFLTMEYVDGEDLGSLLRRIGRLPGDKAVQIARELCAGLQAVHDAGLLHRDLKPSNVMLDGRGRVRIADFGVAALVGGAEGQAGTPAYMAPEQLADAPASVSTDVYALGLVLYETFTGKPAFDSANGEGLAYLKQNSTPTPPTSITPDTDPAVERAILRCLDTDPARRPKTPAHVAAALPGGDPLAAALAAGETPSPELVAGVIDEDAVRPALASWLGASFLALLVVLFALAPQLYIVQKVHIAKPPAVLLDRALEIRRALGYDGPMRGLHTRYIFSTPVLWQALRAAGPQQGAERAAEEASALFTLMVRTAPEPLTPNEGITLTPSIDDPEPSQPGMCDVWIDGQGRLVLLRAVAPNIDSSATRDPAPAFAKAFDLAGFSMESFHSVPPRFQPPLFSDARGAWTGKVARGDSVVMWVELGVAKGRLVSMWSGRSPYFDRASSYTPPAAFEWIGIGFAILLGLIVIGCVIIARRHVLQGRADLRGTGRIASVLSACTILTGLFTSNPSFSADFAASALAFVFVSSCVTFGIVALLYLTLEPVARRTWPEALVSWIRLLDGRVRNARVGHDVLLGLVWALGGMVVLLVVQWAWSFMPWPQPVLSRADDAGLMTDTLTLGGWPLGMLLRCVSFGVTRALIFAAVLSLVTRISRRRALGMGLAVLVGILLNTQGNFDSGYVIVKCGLIAAIVAILFRRSGLLAATAASFTLEVLRAFPLEVPGASWYSEATIVGVGGLLLAAIWAFFAMFGGRPVFSMPDEVPQR